MSLTLLESPVGSGSENGSLQEGALHSRMIEAGGVLTLLVSSGSVWVTMENDPEDYIFAPGESLVFHGPGRLLAEALDGHAEIVFRGTRDATLNRPLDNRLIAVATHIRAAR